MIRVLPPCAARQFVPGESVCTHAANTGRRVGFHECETCSLVIVPEVAAAATELIREPCRHLGLPVGLQSCPTCSGNVRLKVFACELHGECQPTPRLPGVRACQSCADFTVEELDG